MVWRRRYNYSEKIRFGPWTKPHPSFTASTNIGSISNSVLNLVQSPPGDPPRSFHENASKHKKLDTYRWKDPCVLFNGINKIHSYLHLTLILDKVSSSHFLRRNTLCLTDFGHLKRTLDVWSYFYSIVSQFLAENFVHLNLSLRISLHYLELRTLNEHFEILTTQSQFSLEANKMLLYSVFDARQSFTAVPPELKSFHLYLYQEI